MIANQQRLRWGSTSIGDPNKSRKGKSGVKKEQFILESFVTYQQTNLGRVLFAHYLVRVILTEYSIRGILDASLI